jgi:hypothetical protein
MPGARAALADGLVISDEPAARGPLLVDTIRP